MKLEKFILAGTAFCALACLAEPAALPDDGWEAKRASIKNRPRPLILNSDGNEVVYWKTNLPVTVGNFTAQRLETYRGSQVSTVAYCPWSSGFGLMTTTRAGEFLDMPRCIPELQPACHNAAPILKAMGLDCFDLTADYCHTNGMEVFVSIRMNDTHDVGYFIPGTNPPRSYLFPKWKDAHPDCLFGSPSNKPPFCAWSAVDFENPTTRAYMKKFVTDFVENYDVDGIEYDFFRHGQLFKTVGWGAYATEAQLKLMTDFMMELRAITEAAGRKKGRPILVLVRTSDSLAFAKAQGIDVEAWLRRGVMDIWSVSDYFQLDYLRPNAELAHKHGVKFNSALAESRVPGAFGRLKKSNKRFANAIMLPGRNTIASYAAEYSAAMAAGCDGISSFNLSSTGGINKRGLLDVDPRRTKGLDKVYFALVRGSGGYRPESWVKDGGRFYVRPRIDPATIFKIPAGKPYVFGIEFGDEDWANFDMVAKAALAGGQEVITELKVNGKTIAPGAFTDGVHAFPLRPGDLKKGYNEFSVTVDPKFGKELTFHDFAVYLHKSAVAPEKMRAIYEEVKTPHKHGMAIVPEAGEMLDNPMVFRHGGAWYMMFIRFDGKGYETHLAKSDDLLKWTRLGRIFSRGAEGQWDSAQADGWPALVDTRWDGPNTLKMFDGKYWMMYLGGALHGYETDPLSTGVAWTDDPSAVREWTRYGGNPVLSPSDPDARDFERRTIYKHFTVEDPSRTCGGRFVNFYNAKPQGAWRETIGMAVSDDMLHWRRVGDGPVIENGAPTLHCISGDPMIRRIGDVWVMFYFGYKWKQGVSGAFDTFACSYDLKRWTKWEGAPLIEPSADFDRIHAHKPWVLKHDGVVYHWYCAVSRRDGREVRGIALATSRPKNGMSHKTAPDQVSYSRQRLFSGFDGKTCKIQPSIATDGSGTVLLSWQNLLLTGSDVFYGESMAKSTDGGKTFGPGVDQKIFADTWEGKIRTTYYGTVNYSRKNRRWFGLGAGQRYMNDKVPILTSVDGRPATFPMYYTVDPEKGAFTSRHELQVPFDYARTLPFGQKLECENGDLLVPFYVIPKKNDASHKSYCVVTRCRFEGEMLKVVSVGTPLADDTYPRGIGEPSLAKLNGKYYLTLRTDVQGLWSESDDGVMFSKPRPWRWDDGALLENYNTQQHWLRPDGALYLAYTRRGAHNDHVFRHRAPIFMAKFDPARGCLVRATEKILVPELGARLGNFNVIDVAPDESWLITAEWMQPLGCEKYGSDNSLWLARVKFKVGTPSRGALCLTFDDRHFANWQRARAIFKKHGAHATFFVHGAIDAPAAAAMRTLRADGHSLGLHGVKHARAADLLGKLGAEGYRAAEIAPQLDAAHAHGLAIRNWGYPMSQRNAETDAVLGRDFARMRTGCCWRKGKLADDPMKAHDELFVPMAEVPRRTLFFGTPVPSCAEGWLEDVTGALERARDRDEVLVLYAHDITADDAEKDPHNVTRGQLDAILSRAAELNVPVVGFDELGSILR